MTMKLHDRYGHVRDDVEGARHPSSTAYDHPLMRHLSERIHADAGVDAGMVILEALTGKDPEALEAAGPEARGTAPHPAFAAALRDTCGGVDAQVALALAPFLSDEASVEHDDGSGLAWADGMVRAMPKGAGGVIFDSTGVVDLFMELPQTVAAAAAGRRLGDLVDLPPDLGEHRIASCSTGDGETRIVLERAS